MKYRFAIALLIVAGVPACGTRTSTSAVNTLGVKAAIDSLWSGYAHASDQKDAAAFGALFAEDATLDYSGVPTRHGREDIQQFLVALYADVDPTGLRVEPEETKVSGSLAVQSGAFQESFNEKGVSKTEFGRFALIAEQQRDQSWKIHRLVAIADSTVESP